MPIPCDTR